jgi:hypothetical protein
MYRNSIIKFNLKRKIMNNVTKEKVSAAVIKAMSDEKMMNKDVAEVFEFSPTYVSMIKKEDQWNDCPAHAWIKMQTWMYSGRKLKGYKPAPGEVTLTKPEESKDIAMAAPEDKKPKFIGVDMADKISNSTSVKKIVERVMDEPPVSPRKADNDDQLIKLLNESNKIIVPVPAEDLRKKVIVDIEIRVSFKNN